MSEPQSSGGTVSREGDFAVIRVPIREVTSLRAALQECPCKTNKTSAGIERRKSLVRALGRVLSR